MSEKKIKNLALAEVNAARSRLDKNQKEVMKAQDEIDRLRQLIDELCNQQNDLRTDLREARVRSDEMMEFIMESDDENVAALMNELLMAAKLVKDNP